ncbi:hypothetical protein [Streptosporangium carneum]|uniref:Uncharacterized protein n=1 Tax=Streptosporangium carneum TaxID=47481 RepID=A0A9W6I7B6_9ACTN|nr:hypothetical protein [Streptosporangium carneum]GLK12518.1 hypothetical protein GCM10017600_59280 [Streptosporangium carneum]
MTLTSPEHDTWAALTALAAGALTWQSTALMAGLMTARTAMGLLAEWQTRRTLVALARTAPAGLITIRRNASREQTLRLVWGADSDQRRRQSRT